MKLLVKEPLTKAWQIQGIDNVPFVCDPERSLWIRIRQPAIVGVRKRRRIALGGT